ncbi:MAG: UvrD-helicase domain-containing protein [Phycisphaeraceae bacterium]|nr:UvrD-helicase domain-containing protein [Phycisphaerales bacterium]MCB9861660.1 UvrD-helicase domain-containing protein [Phycisphaeraceae bacterium]
MSSTMPSFDPAQNPQPDPLLDDLTDAQRSAVLHRDGPLLILAAAGSGKTRVITRRIAHLVRTGVAPWSILALTFTNKAAGEMRERVMHVLGEGALSRGLTVTTFHSLCARLLRRYAEHADLNGLQPDFSIYVTDDQVSLMKRVIADLDLSVNNWPPRSVLAAISNAKNELQDADLFAASASDFYSRTVAKIFHAYQNALRTANAADFDDLLVLTAKMLRENNDIRHGCASRWQYLMIDEYQDTNRAQLVIATQIAKGRATSVPLDASDLGVNLQHVPNICVVGDPDQSIYGWRGADIRNILDFENQFPGTTTILLGQNFRSTQPVLAVADALIRKNQQRKHKDLFTTTEGGEPVEMFLCRDEQHEAQLMAQWLSDRSQDDGYAWREMAVFYRNNALSRVIEDALRRNGIPYTIARGTSFFQREEVRNLIAYLRLIANHADEVSLMRCINTPARGIGATSITKVQTYADSYHMSLFDALRDAAHVPDLSSRARNAIKDFVSMIDNWTGSGSFMGASVAGSLHELVDRVIEDSGLLSMYRTLAAKSRNETDEQRIGNLTEVVSSARTFEVEYDPSADAALDVPSFLDDEPTIPAAPPLLALLRAYLESIALISDADAIDEDSGSVTLMTLHAAKGLEFPVVGIIGLEEGTLPGHRALESNAELEEERRLCFVGITRAMKRLLISSARMRMIRGSTQVMMPSRFLSEFDPAHVHALDYSGVTVPELSPQIRATSPRSPNEQTIEYEDESGLRKGAVVRHPQFGIGRVVWIEKGSTPRARIAFRHIGEKTFALEYARLEVIA